MQLSLPKTSTRQFSYDPVTVTFTTEISSTNGMTRVYDDAADIGLVLASSVTGNERTFVVSEEHRDSEGDTTHWTLRSTCGTYNMVLFND